MASSTLAIAIVGVGLVGKEFISQLLSLSTTKYPFRVVYISNSTSSISGPEIDLPSWADRLSKSDPKTALRPADLGGLSVSNGSKKVVVDNTSSDEIAALYPLWLKNGWNIVTPNKKACSSDLGLWKDIKAALGPNPFTDLRLGYEATVGAGLPIISTLRDLVETGDDIIKIEGVLSGTLSYIFSEYSPASSSPNSISRSFSSIVSLARENGYTEPHPGDDLNGADVARKLTILSRLVPSLESHLPEGYKSVSITSLVPDELAAITSGNDFVAQLPKFDARYEKLKEEAKAEGKVLRYAGVVDVQSRTIKAALEKYPVTHPFATSLKGSDNIIAFHTKRYPAQPLIVQGAGAGAAVTAMGVLGDVLKLF